MLINCVDMFLHHAAVTPEKPAIWMPGQTPISFMDLKKIAASCQGLMHSRRMEAGNAVLIAAPLSYELYGSIIGLLSMGCVVLFVEPWLPLERINHIVRQVQPKAVILSIGGFFWGFRSSSIRNIEHKILIAEVKKNFGGGELTIAKLPVNQAGIITFTSGTTGAPKGIVRTHGSMIHQHRALVEGLQLNKSNGADIVVFANFTLANLASGKTSLLLPSPWKRSIITNLKNLAGALTPTSLSCGPALLKVFTQCAGPLPLKEVHIGGALVDCKIYTQAFATWPDASWAHVYGGTEAEPVAVSDAKVAVQRSIDKGYLQTLFVGHPIPQIEYELRRDGMWVSGPHVCKQYLDGKLSDDYGSVWHSMGDRIEIDADGSWWYQGRSHWDPMDFEAEQRIYRELGQTACFIQRTKTGKRYLVGIKVKHAASRLRQLGIDGVAEIKKIYYDPRHRSRINRELTIRKAAPWLV